MKSANRMHVAGPTTTPEKTTVEIKFPFMQTQSKLFSPPVFVLITSML